MPSARATSPDGYSECGYTVQRQAETPLHENNTKMWKFIEVSAIASKQEHSKSKLTIEAEIFKISQETQPQLQNLLLYRKKRVYTILKLNQSCRL